VASHSLAESANCGNGPEFWGSSGHSHAWQRGLEIKLGGQPPPERAKACRRLQTFMCKEVVAATRGILTGELDNCILMEPRRILVWIRWGVDHDKLLHVPLSKARLWRGFSKIEGKAAGHPLRYESGVVRGRGQTPELKGWEALQLPPSSTTRIREPELLSRLTL
jgi:hypothetical protein